MNYDSSQIGVPYTRVNNIVISYPANSAAEVTIFQAQAVKLADGTIMEVKPLDSLKFTIDLVGHGTDPIPLVDPTTGAALGPNTTANSLMLGILAAIRARQVLLNV